METVKAGGLPSACLAIVLGRWFDTVVVTVRGEPGASDWERVAHVVDGQADPDVVLDLGGLRRIDPRGVEVLAAVARGCESRGGRLRLGRPRGAVLDLLQAAGLAGLVLVSGEGVTARPGIPSRSRNHFAVLEMRAHPAGTGRHDPPATTVDETRRDPP